MDDGAFKIQLEKFCKAELEPTGILTDLVRLSGGASMESWAFCFNDEPLVLRRMPGGSFDDEEAVRGISLALQADIIEIAGNSGVIAPTVRARMDPKYELGAGFVMAKVDGEALPQKIFGNPQFAEAESKLTDEMGRELAKIHAIAPNSLPASLEYYSPLDLVNLQEEYYRDLGGTTPIYDYAFHWLKQNAPNESEPQLVHGDYRMGNIMFAHDGLTAVLDWELAHLGDPMQDIAYLCTPSWRFGHYDKVAGGFDSAENFFAAYEKHSGTTLDSKRFQFWLVYSTLWWGVACLLMGSSWRSGLNRSIERTVIGRRISEVEVDLMLLFDEMIAPNLRTSLDWQPQSNDSEHGEMRFDELLTSVIEWNKDAVLPGRAGREKFESLVAGNALGMVQRHLAFGVAHERAGERRLDAIGMEHGQLCQALANGTITLEHPGLWDHLRLSALERLSVDQPKYAGLKAAISKWSKK